MKFTSPFAWLLLALGLPAHAEQTVPELQYQSVFDGYQAYADPEIKSWSKAIELVDEIGGWRVYSREPFEGKVDAGAESKTGHKENQPNHHGHHHGGTR